ncbi:MAG: sigma-70 family RNA polymerase sigma factor [Cyanobacteria bacterium J06648_11]
MARGVAVSVRQLQDEAMLLPCDPRRPSTFTEALATNPSLLPGLTALASALCRGQEARVDPGDLVNEACLSMVRYWSSYDPQRGELGAWAHTIVLHTFSRLVRRNLRAGDALDGLRTSPTHTERLDAWSDPAVVVEEREAHLVALERLNSIDGRMKEAFERFYVLGQSSAEISLDMGIQQSAVRGNIARILRRLRDELGDGDDAA